MPTRFEVVLESIQAQLQRNNGYAARLEIERILEPIRDDRSRLEPFGFKVYSQNDEDGILEEIFRLGSVPDHPTGQTEQLPGMGVVQLLECRRVTSTTAIDQRPVLLAAGRRSAPDGRGVHCQLRRGDPVVALPFIHRLSSTNASGGRFAAGPPPPAPTVSLRSP